jgi:peptide/nickel transport system substrate-binding protein
MKHTVAILSLFLLFVPLHEGVAQPQHGLSMHGEPALKEDFESLPYVDPNAPQGGKIIYGQVGSFDSVNPFILKGNAPFYVRLHTFESLMGRSWDEPFTLYGLLAESVEVPEDRSSITFHIRPEAKFSDGTPVTVEDVQFSFETLRDKGRPNFGNAYKKVASVTVAGNSITFSFGEIDRELPLILGLMPVLPKNNWQDKEFQESTLEPMIGSGPYRIATLEPGRSISFVKNPDYWGKDLPLKRGQDNFDKITYEYFRDNDALFEAFKAGVITYTTENDPIRWQSGYPEKVNKAVIDHSRPTGMKGFVFNTRNPLFADIRVREALTLVFDFEWINRALFNNSYTRIQSYFDNSSLAYQAQASETEKELLQPWLSDLPQGIMSEKIIQPQSDGDGRNRKNQKQALELLEDAGWTLQNGKLRNSNGQKLTFEILMPLSGDEKIATVYANMLKRIGIDITVRSVDTAQYQKRLIDYDYDMTVYEWGLSLSPGNEQTFYWGSSGRETPGTRNYMGVESPAVDAMIDALLQAKSKEDFTSAVHALDRVLTSGRYVIPFWYDPVDRVAWWSGLHKPETIPIYGNRPEVWWYERD